VPCTRNENQSQNRDPGTSHPPRPPPALRRKQYADEDEGCGAEACNTPTAEQQDNCQDKDSRHASPKDATVIDRRCHALVTKGLPGSAFIFRINPGIVESQGGDADCRRIPSADAGDWRGA
jgi:hypothetical protein